MAQVGGLILVQDARTAQGLSSFAESMVVRLSSAVVRRSLRISCDSYRSKRQRFGKVKGEVHGDGQPRVFRRPAVLAGD